MKKTMGRIAFGIVLVGALVTGCSRNEVAKDSRIPLPRNNQNLIVHQNTADRLRYTLLTDDNRDGYWDYVVEVDDFTHGNRTRNTYVDSTIKFKGPVYESNCVKLVGPDFFKKYL